jgi:chaperonin GroES
MLHPMNGYLVLEPWRETVTKSGLFIPENTKEKPMRGTIFAAGAGWGIGQHLLYSKYGAIEVKYEGRDLIIIRERDVIAAITDADE